MAAAAPVRAPTPSDTPPPLMMVLAETSSGQTITYWHGLDTLAQSDGTNVSYFEYDGLGSVRQVVDGAGEVGLSQTFDPYGNLYASAGTAGQTKYAFTGEQQDDNGLLFLRARYYNPSAGRLFQTDPSRKELNAYIYAAGNPVMYVDPNGLVATRSKAVEDARTWATRSFEEWELESGLWIPPRRYETPTANCILYKDCPSGTQAYEYNCEDCTRFASWVLWRAGFEMDGKRELRKDGSWYYTNPTSGPGWWANSNTINRATGEADAWASVKNFRNYWTLFRHSFDGRSAIEIREGMALGYGDIVLFDYDSDWNFDHAAIVTDFGWYHSPKVTSRGNIDQEYWSHYNRLMNWKWAVDNNRLDQLDPRYYITPDEYDQWQMGYDGPKRCDYANNAVDIYPVDSYWGSGMRIIGLRMPYDN